MAPPSRKPRSLTVGVLAASFAFVGAALLVAPRACSSTSTPPTAGVPSGVTRPGLASDAAVTRASSSVDLPVQAEAPRPFVPVVAAARPEESSAELHRMQAFTVALDGQRLRLERAVVLPGRVKAPPLSYAAERVEFEAFDLLGNRVYQGSFDHPAHRHGERFAPNGEITRLPMKVDDASLTLRIPGDLAVARIDFFETHGANRTALGSVEPP